VVRIQHHRRGRIQRTGFQLRGVTLSVLLLLLLRLSVDGVEAIVRVLGGTHLRGSLGTNGRLGDSLTVVDVRVVRRLTLLLDGQTMAEGLIGSL
ncbi:hypothetical protein PENTCL1PPCAC_4408, partial [Pristionchus entomophagus]